MNKAEIYLPVGFEIDNTRKCYYPYEGYYKSPEQAVTQFGINCLIIPLKHNGQNPKHRMSLQEFWEAITDNSKKDGCNVHLQRLWKDKNYSSIFEITGIWIDPDGKLIG